jgi:D-alanyl-D-alanine carboxypeptidase/D-alanyl-D-alanine-endopeptidase (penicillin-binding protein 4)
MVSGVWRILGVGLGLGAAAGAVAAQGKAEPAPPPPTPTLQEELARWFRDAARRAPGEWGVAVADHNGRLIWGVEPTRPLIPASTVKLLTTGYARSVVGGDARKSTRVVGLGRLAPETGAWEGTWALEVNGDPSLERSEAGPRLTDLAAQLVDRGIRRLAGPFTVVSATGDANATWPSSWERRHRGRVFAPLVGNLTVNNNLLSLSLAPGAKVGAKAVLIGAAPDGIDRLVSVTARTVAGRRSRLGLASQNGRFVVTGTIGIRARTRSLVRASQDPRALLEASWAAALAKAGIEWSPAAGLSAADARGPVVLAEVRSPIFDSLAAEINRRSSNLGAELLLQWAANGDPVAGDRLTAHVQQITGDYAGVHLVDGSGLSQGNRVSPLTFVSYLARFPLAPGGRNFPMLLPPNGTGTLWKLGNGLPQRGVVRAKTGTLGNVASLVGYLGRPDGVLLLSLIYNGGRVYDARQAQWRLFRLLGAEGVVVPGDSLDPDREVGGAVVP